MRPSPNSYHRSPQDVVDSLYDPTVDLEDDLTSDTTKTSVPGKKKKRKKRETTAKLDSNDEFFENEEEKNIAEGELIEYEIPSDFGGGHPYVALNMNSVPSRESYMQSHVAWARMLSRDPTSGVLVEGSHQVLREDMKGEDGGLLVVRVNRERREEGGMGEGLLEGKGSRRGAKRRLLISSFLRTRFARHITNNLLLVASLLTAPHRSDSLSAEPIIKESGMDGVEVCRWGRNVDDPLLNIDSGKVLDVATLYEKDEDTSYLPRQWVEWELDETPAAPYMAWCKDKTNGVDGLRKATREVGERAKDGWSEGWSEAIATAISNMLSSRFARKPLLVASLLARFTRCRDILST